MAKKFDTVFWDWNGTLLDDLRYSVSIINTLLEEHSLPLLNTESYQDVFKFPVQEYYRSIGLPADEPEFSVVGKVFIDRYNQNRERCEVFADALLLVKALKEHGIKQYVISAYSEDSLISLMKQKNVHHYFDGIAGLDNIYAHSKLERGLRLIESENIVTEKAVMIGDTEHDVEVAHALGCSAVTISWGHQSSKRLLTVNKSEHKQTFSELKEYLLS